MVHVWSWILAGVHFSSYSAVHPIEKRTEGKIMWAIHFSEFHEWRLFRDWSGPLKCKQRSSYLKTISIWIEPSLGTRNIIIWKRYGICVFKNDTIWYRFPGVSVSDIGLTLTFMSKMSKNCKNHIINWSY